MRRKNDKEQNNTELAISAAAEELFLENGYNLTTTTMIARPQSSCRIVMTSSIGDNLQNFQPCGAWTMISQIFMIPQLSADFKGISQKNSGSPEDPPPGKSREKMEQMFAFRGAPWYNHSEQS